MNKLDEESLKVLRGKHSLMLRKARREGVPLHPDWKLFDGFWRDMEAGWEFGLSLKRRRPAEGFVPGNCFWGRQGREPDPDPKPKPPKRPRGRPPGSGHVWVLTDHGPMKWSDASLLYSQYRMRNMPRISRPEGAK